MRNTADTDRPPRRVDLTQVAPYILTVGAVLLAWQIISQPLAQRLPVELAIRVAPASPLVLRRAAEGELSAGRNENAAALGREALRRSPFDVRALRVVGLTEARSGRRGVADEILTLAGNWSLRDDPTHAWLVEQRLRNGDYGSAFAHADTLVRRRVDIQPQVFRLFTIAATEDPQRALPVLARLLAENPPWRVSYLSGLNTTNEGLQVQASLAVLLQSSAAPLKTGELQSLYQHLLNSGQIEALTTVRSRLNRPRSDTLVANGGFDDADAPHPFQWTLIQKAGASAEVLADDINPSDLALRVEYDGYTPAVIGRQQIFLTPGRYRFSARSKTESGVPSDRVEWAVTCLTGEALAEVPAVPPPTARSRDWVTSAGTFSVPASCTSQWLDLRGLPLDRRTPMVVWFDQVTVVPFDQTQD